mgnify:FL=1
MKNFDLKKFLIENKLTPSSRVLKEITLKDGAKLKKLTLGGKSYAKGEEDPNDDGRIETIEKYANGYAITGGMYSDYGDGDAAKEMYTYAIDLKGNEMDEEDLEGRFDENVDKIDADLSSNGTSEEVLTAKSYALKYGLKPTNKKEVRIIELALDAIAFMDEQPGTRPEAAMKAALGLD